jgi:DNA-binding MarR family transcriptional regulator
VKETTLALDAWESLFRAQVSVLRRLNAEFPTTEISFNEYDVLFNLSLQPSRELRIRDLNRHLLLTQPSVSRMVDRLAMRGLVSKHSDPADARGTVVLLTEEGHRLFRKVAIVHAKSIREHVGSAMSTDELKQLRVLSDKLRRECDRDNAGDSDNDNDNDNDSDNA